MNTLRTFCCAILVIVGLSYARTEKLVILHTNDMHAELFPNRENKGGFANIADYFKYVKRKNDKVIILDAGDMTQGSPVSSYYNGYPIFDIMSTMGYDCAVLGNHEFDNGYSHIETFKKYANFPIICSNLKVKNKLLADAPYKIFDINGLKVGVLGITTEEHIIEGVDAIPHETVMKKYWEEFNRKSDIQILLSHLGVKYDSAMAQKYPGIDVIVGGHSHTSINNNHKVNKTIIAHAGDEGHFVGRLDIIIDTDEKEVMSFTQRLNPIIHKRFKEHRPTKKNVKKWDNTVSPIVDIEIGWNRKKMEPWEFNKVIEESWRNIYKTDFSIQNSGGTRKPLPQGRIFKRHIWRILPFNKNIEILSLTKKQILKIIPHARFIEDKKYYTIATNTYKAKEIVRILRLEKDKSKQIDENHRDAVIRYIERIKHL